MEVRIKNVINTYIGKELYSKGMLKHTIMTSKA